MFIKEKMVNGGSDASVARKVGFSESIANNPQKITRSKSYSDYLDAAGLTNEKLAETHQGLMDAAKMSDFVLPFRPGKKKKGRRYSTTPIEHSEIEKMFDNLGKIVRIDDDYKHRYHIIYYHAPIGTDRKAGLELALKAKNLLSAERYEVTLHETTPDEKTAVDSALKIIN